MYSRKENNKGFAAGSFMPISAIPWLSVASASGESYCAPQEHEVSLYWRRAILADSDN